MASLTALIEAGLVKPGRGSLQLTYKGTAFEADVLADGRVQSGSRKFHHVHQWALAQCRTITPRKRQIECSKFVRHRGKRLRQYQQMYRQQQQALHSDASGEEPHQQQQAADSTGGGEDSSEDDDEEDSDGQGAGSEEDGRSVEEGDGQDEDERCTAGSGGAGASGDPSRPRSSGPDTHGPRRSRHAATQRTARQPALEPVEWPYISEAQLELAAGSLHTVHAAANFLRTPCGLLLLCHDLVGEAAACWQAMRRRYTSRNGGRRRQTCLRDLLAFVEYKGMPKERKQSNMLASLTRRLEELMGLGRGEQLPLEELLDRLPADPPVAEEMEVYRVPADSPLVGLRGQYDVRVRAGSKLGADSFLGFYRGVARFRHEHNLAMKRPYPGWLEQNDDEARLLLWKLGVGSYVSEVTHDLIPDDLTRFGFRFKDEGQYHLCCSAYECGNETMRINAPQDNPWKSYTEGQRGANCQVYEILVAGFPLLAFFTTKAVKGAPRERAEEHSNTQGRLLYDYGSEYWEVNAEEISMLAKSEEARRASEEARRAKEAHQLAEAHIADLQRQLQLLQSRASAPGPTQQPSGGSRPPPAAPLDAMSADERHTAVADGAGGAGAAAAPPEVTSLAPLTGAAAATAADAEQVLVHREHPAGADAATPATARGRFATPATTSSGGRSIGPPHGEQPASEVQSTPQLTRQAAEPAAGPTLEPATKLESEPAAAVAETPACIGDAVPFPQRQQQQQQQQQGQQAEEPPPAVAHALLELRGAQAALEEAQRAQQEAQRQLGQRAVEEATSQLAQQEAEVAAAAADTALAEARATLQRRREGREAAARAEAAQLQGELKEKAQAFDDSFWKEVPVSAAIDACYRLVAPAPGAAAGEPADPPARGGEAQGGQQQREQQGAQPAAAQRAVAEQGGQDGGEVLEVEGVEGAGPLQSLLELVTERRPLSLQLRMVFAGEEGATVTLQEQLEQFPGVVGPYAQLLEARAAHQLFHDRQEAAAAHDPAGLDGEELAAEARAQAEVAAAAEATGVARQRCQEARAAAEAARVALTDATAAVMAAEAEARAAQVLVQAEEEAEAERRRQEEAAERRRQEAAAERRRQEEAAERWRQQVAAEQRRQEAASELWRQHVAAERRRQEEETERRRQQVAAKRRQQEGAATRRRKEAEPDKLRGEAARGEQPREEGQAAAPSGRPLIKQWVLQVLHPSAGGKARSRDACHSQQQQQQQEQQQRGRRQQPAAAAGVPIKRSASETPSGSRAKQPRRAPPGGGGGTSGVLVDLTGLLLPGEQPQQQPPEQEPPAEAEIIDLT